MDVTPVHVGQRIRINVPGIGDHGQLGTSTKVQRHRCFIRLDWDQRRQHVVWFYAKDLDPVPRRTGASGGVVRRRNKRHQW